MGASEQKVLAYHMWTRTHNQLVLSGSIESLSKVTNQRTKCSNAKQNKATFWSCCHLSTKAPFVAITLHLCRSGILLAEINSFIMLNKFSIFHYIRLPMGMFHIDVITASGRRSIITSTNKHNRTTITFRLSLQDNNAD